MALRVLLADQSTTIKKVIELALQDFAVEVHSVNTGVDVLPIAEKVQPDIFFVDVLLPKRSGYDVVIDIKKHPQLKSVPVVIMWSGFMDLDETKLTMGRPEARLEKPFETDLLRKTVRKLVPKLGQQPLDGFLDFSQMEQNSPQDLHADSAPAPKNSLKRDSSWQQKPVDDEYDFDEEEFSKVSLKDLDKGGVLNTKQPPASTDSPEGLDFSQYQMTAPVLDNNDDAEFTGIDEISLDGFDSNDNEPMMQTDAADFEPMDLSNGEADESPVEDEAGLFEINTNDLDAYEEPLEAKVIDDDFRVDISAEELEMIDQVSLDANEASDDNETTTLFSPPTNTEAKPQSFSQNSSSNSNIDLSASKELIEEAVKKHVLHSLTLPELERHVSTQAAEIISEIAWKVIPEIAVKIIREELNSLMKAEAEKIKGPSL